jgi:carbonic anhydrase/acetyltransferase-like protein (isoleucine patch superfamily)
MPNVFAFGGFVPVIHQSAFIHPNAAITGNVIIGRNVYVGPGAAIRGDWGAIEIADGCNVQENCTIHAFPGLGVTLAEDAHVGHGAVIHGAQLGRNVLIGMNAVVMDHARIGDDAIIGALTFVPSGMEIPARKLALGSPARVIKDVTDEMLEWKREGTRLYQRLPDDMRDSWAPCEPLRALPAERPAQPRFYRTWNETRGG